MTDKRRPDVMSSLPSTRPQRRSGKRAAMSGGDAGSAASATAGKKSAAAPKKPVAAKKPAAAPTRPAETRAPATAGASSPQRAPEPRAPEPESRPGVLGTAVQAGIELGEIGLRIGVRTLRAALARMPRP